MSDLSSNFNGLINSQYVGLGWGYRLKPHTTVTTEIFYHHQTELPASTNDLSWNYLSDPFFGLLGEGSATSYGIDLSLKRDFYSGWY